MRIFSVLIILLLFSGCGERPAAGGSAPATGKSAGNAPQPASADTQESASKPSGLLAGHTLCIDPGHQAVGDATKEPIAPGSDLTKDKMAAGATGVATRVPEYKLNLAVSLKLKATLGKLGAKVLMTRETNDVKSTNVERAQFANASQAELVIRIHADGSADAKVRGLSVLYPGSQYVKNETLLSSSKRAANDLLSELVLATGAASRGTSERNDMTGFNWSTRPVILVEMGFMSNPEEDRLMETDDYQDKLVAGMCKGVVRYFAK